MTRLATCIQIVSNVIRGFSKKYGSSVLGELGRGAGKRVGGGGPIREIGGQFDVLREGKIGASREEDYYYKVQQRLLSELKVKLREENNLREQEIKQHQQAIQENNRLAKDIEKKISHVQ